MRTRIVPREEVMATITSRLGDKGFLGNQEIGGGCPSASLRRFAMGMTVETFFSMETDLMPTLKMRDYKDPPVIVYEAD